jgi:hypothetical protein
LRIFRTYCASVFGGAAALLQIIAIIGENGGAGSPVLTGLGKITAKIQGKITRSAENTGLPAILASVYGPFIGKWPGNPADLTGKIAALIRETCGK